MRKAIYLTVIFLTFFITKIVLATSTPQLLINEIMYDPQGADSDHEWLEVVNISENQDYLLSEDWRINDGSNHVLEVVQGDLTISHGEYWVITDDAEVFLQDYPDFSGTLIDSVLSLNNSGESLMLSFDQGQTFFATTTYQVELGAGNNGRSLERIDLGQSWQESFMLGGTPGQANSQAQVNSAPTAAIIASPTGTVDQLLEFTASSTDPDGDNLSYLWNFGDQGTSTEMATTHSFGQAAEYTVSLTVSDGFLSASATRVVIISQTAVERAEEGEEDDNNEQQANIVYSNQMVINEIMPNPQGSDSDAEWIELYNLSQSRIDLSGWLLSDSTDRRYEINQEDFLETTIEPFGYLVVLRSQSGIALNNGDDQVQLYQPDGSLLDQVEYSAAVEGESYAKIGGKFQWTNRPTLGQANLISQIEQVEELFCPEPEVIYITKEPEVKSEVDNNIEFDLADYAGLMISEFMPNPAGPDRAEWLELYNNSSSSLNLAGWFVDDQAGGSTPYQLPNNTVLEPFGFLMISQSDSGLALNNSYDTVRILDPNQEIFLAVDYEQAKEDFSYSFDLINEEWFWSAAVTPGEVNQPALTEVLTEQKLALAAEQVEYPVYTVNQLKELDKGEQASLVGLVTAPPKLLGSRVMYLIEPDFSAGLQIYSSNGDYPDLKIGQLVEVKGKVSEVQGEKRLNLVKDQPVKILDQIEVIDPELMAIDDIGDELIGSLVKVSGELVERKGSNYYLDDGSGEIRVYLKESAGIDSPEVAEGYIMTVQGVLSLTKSGYRLLPIFEDNINVGQIAGESEEFDLVEEEVVIESDQQNQQIIKTLLMTAGGLLVLLSGLVIKLKFFK
ncbi:MAG: hypothetical protein COU22_03300 [Candidatus Komeilibacteria bacterium CG10_big_fil_rev_8_21_14_0_10_41_13]|uniref:PKD domain-containing protein n=1 Tax=Candidatus Komeilibacteria bacterium CG10_big_fil_rev_8_21_14_0_10_41_13 TaxID=1974476 RepID=A0A2M6WBV9_9BACT|nr:MAG: hypothetical protein COU22_03300 [Candidatus Komeilibacteria bacterium CG10_big_fil_rev_8_21_14_0_10_41_13]